MLPEPTTATLLHHWDEGWNTGDLATIVAPFAEDIVFGSPFVPKLTGDPAKTTLEGLPALRSYLQYALEHAPGIRYTVEASYTGTDTLVLVYTCHTESFVTNPTTATAETGVCTRIGCSPCPPTFGRISNPDGSSRRGSDYLRVDAGGKVAEWRCHYFREPGL